MNKDKALPTESVRWTHRANRQHWLKLALQAGRMVAWEQDLRTGYVTRSEKSEDLIGVGSGPLAEVLMRIHPDDRHIRENLGRSDAPEEIEFRCITPEGDEIWLATRVQKVSRYRLVGISFDITEHKNDKARIYQLAHSDTLTGLPNRLSFGEHLDNMIEKAARNEESVSVCIIDFDFFKDINDTFGHDAGDAFLQEIAERLRKLAGPTIVPARLSGDEFAVAAYGYDQASGLNLAKRIARTAGKQIIHNGHALGVKASVGLAVFPEHAQTRKDLMKAADIALFEAKKHGRNQVRLYKDSMGQIIRDRSRVIEEMETALRYGAVMPFYQPKIDLTTGQVIGFEVLARWHHPSRGILAPAAFWACFEDQRLSLRLTSYLFKRVLRDVRFLGSQGFDIGVIAFNLSNVAFGHPKIAEGAINALRYYDVPADQIEIEVTEDVLLGRNEAASIRKIRTLREAGIRVALDDFGTGHASLAHLGKFQIDNIKIDKSFVGDFQRKRGSKAIVEAILTIGRGFGLDVTVEGVETEEQAVALKQMGCRFAQGYFFGRPMPCERVADFLGKSPRFLL